MAVSVPGFGLAPFLHDVAPAWRVVAMQMAELATARPNARLVRNEVGNLSIIEENGTSVVHTIGYIDVLVPEIVVTESEQ